MTNVVPVPDPLPGVRLDQQLPIPSEDLTRQYRQIESDIL